MQVNEASVQEAPNGGPAPKRAALLVNTKSRRGQEWFEDAQRQLTALGVELECASSFQNIKELLDEAQNRIKEQVPLIIAGGGDGTFNALADMFVGSKSVLGVLPLGTGNSFARDLQIPADLAEACEIAANGKVVNVDLGWTNGTHFVNVATVGLTTKIAQSLTNPMKKKFGRFVYAIAIVKALRHIKPFQATLETENGRQEFETLEVVIGNGRYHAGPFPVSPEASIVEGRLSLYAVESASKASLLKLALSLPGGHHVGLREVHSEQTKGGILTTFPPKAVTVDGEVCQQTPLEFRSAPGALRVVVPTGFGEAG